MEKALVNEIQHTSDKLFSIIGRFGQEIFNEIPFKGSWTPGQVTEHVYLYSAGILNTVNGNTGPTQRDPAQMVAPLRDAFLDFTIKMQSPDFILPSNNPQDKASLLHGLKDAWTGLALTAGTQDLHATCLDFDMPTVGPMTRLEWISFTVAHTQRHIWQLEKMAAIMGV